MEKVSSHAMRLALPRRLSRLHPVFHVSMLEPHQPSQIPDRTVPPPPPVEVEGKLEFEVERILDLKIDRRRRCKLLYLVKWLGYDGTDEDTSWVPADELGNSTEAVADFHLQYPDRPGPISQL